MTPGRRNLQVILDTLRLVSSESIYLWLQLSKVCKKKRVFTKRSNGQGFFVAFRSYII